MTRRIDRPILGSDVLGVIPFVLNIPMGQDLASTRAEHLRRAELLRRFYPDQALAELDALPAGEDHPSPVVDAAAIRAHALLEQGNWGAATVVVPDLPSGAGVRELVLGRLAVARGDVDGALDYFTRSIAAARASDDVFSPEVETEALGLRGRLRLTQPEGEEGGLEDLLAVEELCAAHDAMLTRSEVSILRSAVQTGKTEDLAQGIATLSARKAEAEYGRPFVAQRAEILPVPLHVHGALKRHHKEPGEFVERMLQLSALRWRAGDKVAGLETATYAHRIGQRVFGPEAVSDLGLYLQALEQREGTASWNGLMEQLRARAREANEARAKRRESDRN